MDSKQAADTIGLSQPCNAEGWLFSLPWAVEIAGGVNQVVLNLAREMASDGQYRPYIAENVWRRYRVGQSIFQGLDVLRLWTPAPWTTRRPVIGCLNYLIELPFTLLRLAAFLRRFRITVVNVHYPNLSALNWLMLRRLGLFRGHLMLSLHGRDIRDAARGSLPVRTLWRVLLRGADAVVACSKGLATETEALFNLAADSVVTIHNGVSADLHRHGVARPAPGDLGGRDYIANVATFEHKKAHDVLVQAFSIVAERYPDIDLVIAGRHGETYHSILAQVREAGLQNRVHLYEDLRHAEALAVIEGARFFVLPSRNEGFAVTLLEACALGKPVIATAVCGVEELIDNDRTGRIVPAGDADTLAAAICEFLDQPERVQAMAERARMLVERRFGWAEKSAAYRALCITKTNAKL
ncbi:MAG: glycosyltransferase family 4 protein [Pseudomonadales bacterium]|nr:glycosyltransferase family 4 protein [Pseudomonadales bacterium]